MDYNFIIMEVEIYNVLNGFRVPLVFLVAVMQKILKNIPLCHFLRYKLHYYLFIYFIYFSNFIFILNIKNMYDPWAYQSCTEFIYGAYGGTGFFQSGYPWTLSTSIVSCQVK